VTLQEGQVLLPLPRKINNDNSTLPAHVLRVCVGTHVCSLKKPGFCCSVADDLWCHFQARFARNNSVSVPMGLRQDLDPCILGQSIFILYGIFDHYVP
jgi:hypothetical protein